MHESVLPLPIRVLYFLPLALVLAASLLGWRRYRQLVPSMRALALLAGFDALMELLGFVLLWLHVPNIFLFPLILVGEMGLLLLTYSRALQSAGFRRVAPWIFGLLALYALLNSALAPGTLDYRPSLRVIGDLLPLLLAGLYFRQLLNELRVEQLTRDPLFWLSSGLVLYTLGDLLIALFSNYLFTTFSRDLNRLIWLIHNFLNAVLYACYCVALWLPAGPDRAAPR
ncbi:MAG: hypothetical protein EOO59_21600, partial [Hymenobacter sp.]